MTKHMISTGSGIGRETALMFAERGARAVVFADCDIRTASEASKKSKSVATVANYQTAAIAVDVQDRASIKAMIEEVIKRFTRLDYAVNSVGVSIYLLATISIPVRILTEITLVHRPRLDGRPRLIL